VPFTPLQVADQDLNRVQQQIQQAIAAIDTRLNTTIEQRLRALETENLAIVSFVVNGHNGAGTVALAAIPQTDGTTRRATKGARVGAVVNLTDDVDEQTLFEATISTQDQIQQIFTTDLSAKKLLVIVQVPA